MAGLPAIASLLAAYYSYASLVTPRRLAPNTLLVTRDYPKSVIINIYWILMVDFGFTPLFVDVTSLSILAKGSKDGTIWPNMVVEIDGAEVLNTTVTESWAQYFCRETLHLEIDGASVSLGTNSLGGDWELPSGDLAGTIVEPGNSVLLPVRFSPANFDEDPALLRQATVRIGSPTMPWH